MRGLEPKAVPLRVVISGDGLLVEALSDFANDVAPSVAQSSLDVSAMATRADVLVVDTGVDPLGAYDRIRSRTVRTPVLALVAGDDAGPALAAGAAGAVRRDAPPDVIVAAIKAIDEGLGVVDRQFLAQFVAAGDVAKAAAAGAEALTRRENEVLALMAEGLSNKEIASKLSISDHTAKFHVNSILQKMGAQKRVEAVVRAARRGIIDL